MKYKLGDEVYLKGVITSINSCAEINYPYEVKTAGEFVTAAEELLEPINKSELGHAEEAPRYLRNILARLRGLPEHDREVWLKGIMDEFELDFSHAKWREGYDVEQKKRYEVKLKNTGDYLVKTNNDDYHFYNNIYTQNRKHTREELEDAGFGWVFDCEGVEVQEVQDDTKI